MEPDDSPYKAHVRAIVERSRGKRRPTTVVDFELARVRKVKRLVTRTLKELVLMERDLVKLRKADKE